MMRHGMPATARHVRRGTITSSSGLKAVTTDYYLRHGKIGHTSARNNQEIVVCPLLFVPPVILFFSVILLTQFIQPEETNHGI
jgi:hypothetical protein